MTLLNIIYRALRSQLPLVAIAIVLLTGLTTVFIVPRQGEVLPATHKVLNSHSQVDIQRGVTNSDTSSGDSSSGSQSPLVINRQSNTPGQLPVMTDPLTPSMIPIVASPSSLAITASGLIDLRSSSGQGFRMPTVTTTEGLDVSVVSVSTPPSSFNGGIWLPTAYDISVAVQQRYRSTNGTGSLTISAPGTTTLNIPVSWRPTAEVTIIKGPLVRTDDTNTISYTAYFTLSHDVVFTEIGTPTITVKLTGTYACINTNDLSEGIQYAGNDIFSMSCIVQRFVPSPGVPPPPAEPLSFTLLIGMSAPYGGISYSPTLLGYTSTQSPFNQ